MTNLKQITISLVAAATGLGSAGVANAATLVATPTLQTTYETGGAAVTFDYDAASTSVLKYTEYFQTVSSSSIVAAYSIGPVSGTGSYAVPAMLYNTALTYQLVAVPEPVTWALMLVGFGAIGMGLRHSTRRNLRTA